VNTAIISHPFMIYLKYHTLQATFYISTFLMHVRSPSTYVDFIL